METVLSWEINTHRMKYSYGNSTKLGNKYSQMVKRIQLVHGVFMNRQLVGPSSVFDGCIIMVTLVCVGGIIMVIVCVGGIIMVIVCVRGIIMVIVCVRGIVMVIVCV